MSEDRPSIDHTAISRAFLLMEDALEILDSAGACLAAAKLDLAIEALPEPEDGIRIRRESSIDTSKFS